MSCDDNTANVEPPPPPLPPSPTDSRAGVVYADCLTQLYESLARSLEGHQAMVESYYGEHCCNVVPQYSLVELL